MAASQLSCWFGAVWPVFQMTFLGIFGSGSLILHRICNPPFTSDGGRPHQHDHWDSGQNTLCRKRPDHALFWRKSRANLVFRMYFLRLIVVDIYRNYSTFLIILGLKWEILVGSCFLALFLLLILSCFIVGFWSWPIRWWSRMHTALIRLFLFMHTSVCCYFLNSFYFLGLMSLVI